MDFQAPPPAPRVPAESWTYASGRVAALEGALLPREALERLAHADSPAAAAAALAESPLRGAAGEPRAPAAAAAAVALFYSAARAGLRADCPDPTAFALMDLPRRYRALKERLRGALSGAGRGEAGADRLEEALGADRPEGPAGAALGLLAAALAADDRPEPALATDLLLDSARLLEALELAARLGSPAVAAHVAGEVRARSALVAWRTRLLAGKEGGDSALARWLPRLFLRGELGRGLAARLWATDFPAWPGLLAAELSAALAGEAFGSGEEERLSGWERAAFNWLTARAREFRTCAFGAERVYGYAWALAVEERNVRLALVGRLKGVAPEAIKALLWEPYGG